MKKHRGLIMGLGLAALLSLAVTEAQAGPLTVTITLGNGASISINAVNQNVNFTGAGSDSNTVNLDIATINDWLNTHGSAFNFTNQGSSSLNPIASLGENGEVQVVNTGANVSNVITIADTQTDFTSPSGTGMLNSAASGTWNNATVGDSVTGVQSSLDAVLTAPANFSYNGASNPQGFSNGTGVSAPATGSPGGYSLDNTATITMALTQGARTAFSVQATFNAVPEPASLIMMVTGMPLPLVVMGLLRRRRAAA